MLKKYYIPIKNNLPFFILAILIFFNVIFSLFFPVYPDEINWRVLYSRIISFDFVSQTYLIPCGDTRIKVNILLYPFLRIFDLFSTPTIFNLRIIPVLAYLFYLFLIYKLLLQKLLEKKWTLILISSISSLIFFSNSTFAWNGSSRPEFFIFIFLSFCLLYLHRLKFLSDNKKLFFIIIILFSWLLACSAHPKFLYFIPISIFIIYISRFKLFLNLAIYAILICYIFIIVDFQTNTIVPQSCLTTQFRDFFLWMQSFSINPFNFFKNPKDFIYEFYINIPRHFDSILNAGGINHFIFSANPRGNFLPSLHSNSIISITNLFITIIFVLSLIFSIFLFILKTPKFFSLDLFNKFIYLLFLCIFILLILNRTTNNYDVSLWLKLMTSGLLLYFIYNFEYFNNSFKFDLRWIRISAILFLLILFFSTAIIYRYYFIKYTSDAHWYYMSTPIKYFTSKNKKDISNFYQTSCFKSESEYLLFDDHTYSVFTDKLNSFPITYTALPFFWNGKNDQESLSNWFLSQEAKISIYSSCDFNHMINSDIFKLTQKYEKYNLCCYIKY